MKHGKEQQKVTHSVRGVEWIQNKGYLYVADEPAGLVKVYGPDGTYVGASTTAKGTSLKTPVHLLYAAPYLYVSTSEGIMYADLDVGNAAAPSFSGPVTMPSTIPDISGMTLGPSGEMYVGSRTTKTCWTLAPFTPPSGPASATPWSVHQYRTTRNSCCTCRIRRRGTWPCRDWSPV